MSEEADNRRFIILYPPNTRGGEPTKVFPKIYNKDQIEKWLNQSAGKNRESHLARVVEIHPVATVKRKVTEIKEVIL